MGDPQRSPISSDVKSIFGHAIGKTYKFVTKWNADKSPTNKSEHETEAKFEAYKKGLNRGSVDDNYISRSSGLEKCTSRRSHTPGPRFAYITKSTSRHSQSKRSTSRKSGPLLYESEGSNRGGSKTSSELSEGSARRGRTSSESIEGSSTRRGRTSSETSEGSSRRGRTSSDLNEGSTRRGRTSEPTVSESGDPTSQLSRNTSRRSPIIFSQTTAVRRKPPPVERILVCTLEELCEGSVKKIKINREIVSDKGTIMQEEEIVRVKLKPGWRRGTKITFEGKGDQKPGYLPTDIIFSIEEKRHPLFRRNGDDLEIGVEIPLVQALTGCSLDVPLLGNERINLSFDDEIIFPDCEKVIQGQGMPNPKEEGKRGDLKIRFLVEFPTDLTNEQRSQACTILQHSS